MVIIKIELQVLVKMEKIIKDLKLLLENRMKNSVTVLDPLIY